MISSSQNASQLAVAVVAVAATSSWPNAARTASEARMAPASCVEPAGEEHGEGDGGVEVTAGDLAERVETGQEREAEAERDDDHERLVGGERREDRDRADEDEGERAEQLCYVAPGVVLHGAPPASGLTSRGSRRRRKSLSRRCKRGSPRRGERRDIRGDSPASRPPEPPSARAFGSLRDGKSNHDEQDDW
jgi:hypothetical protein